MVVRAAQTVDCEMVAYGCCCCLIVNVWHQHRYLCEQNRSVLDGDET